MPAIIVTSLAVVPVLLPIVEKNTASGLKRDEKMKDSVDFVDLMKLIMTASIPLFLLLLNSFFWALERPSEYINSPRCMSGRLLAFHAF